MLPHAMALPSPTSPKALINTFILRAHVPASGLKIGLVRSTARPIMQADRWNGGRPNGTN